MPEGKINADTTVMLIMQKLISAADEAFDNFKDKDDNTFVSITMTPDYIWCDLLEYKKCGECGNSTSDILARLTFNRKTKMSHLDA